MNLFEDFWVNVGVTWNVRTPVWASLLTQYVVFLLENIDTRVYSSMNCYLKEGN